MKILKTILFYAAVMIISVLGIYPYLNDYYISATGLGPGVGDDISFHAVNMMALGEKITHLDFSPLYWMKGGGYGPITMVFYPQIFTIIGALMIAASIPAIIAWKAYIFILTFITFLSMYYIAKKFFGKVTYAWICSILYVFSIYRMGDIFARAALGEVIAFIFLPFFVYAIYEILYRDQFKKWYLIPLVFFFILNSHIVSAFFIVMLLFLYLVINSNKIIKNKALFRYLLIAFGFSVLVTLSMSIPQIEQRLVQRLIVPGPWWNLNDLGITFEKPFENRIYGIASMWGIGKTFCFVPLFALFFLKKEEDKAQKRFFLHSFAFMLVFLLFSYAFMDLTKLRAFYDIFQFPYRLLMIVTLLVCFVMTYNIKSFCESVGKAGFPYLESIIIVLLLINSYDVVYRIQDINKHWSTNHYWHEVTASDISEYSNIDYYPADFNFNNTPSYAVDMRTNARYDSKFDGRRFIIDYEGGSDISIIAPSVYYKGYTAKFVGDDGKRTKLATKLGDEGKLKIEGVNNGVMGKIIVRYPGTVLQHVSNIISYGSVLFLIWIWRINKKVKVES